MAIILPTISPLPAYNSLLSKGLDKSRIMLSAGVKINPPSPQKAPVSGLEGTEIRIIDSNSNSVAKPLSRLQVMLSAGVKIDPATLVLSDEEKGTKAAIDFTNAAVTAMQAQANISPQIVRNLLL